MNLTPEEKKVGQDNYHEALGAMDKSDYTDRAACRAAISSREWWPPGPCPAPGSVRCTSATAKSPTRCGSA